MIKNQIKMSFASQSENVGIARICAAAFAAQMDLTINELEEIKVAVSEAVTNAVVHGYGSKIGTIDLLMNLHENSLEYIVSDHGKGIADIALARQPSYSSDPERMGLGFVFMESFMDDVNVESEPGKGTTVTMIKKCSRNDVH